MRCDLRRYWPSGLTALVTKAAFHSDLNVAKEAWKNWQEQCDFDKAWWSDLRVASLAHRRLGALLNPSVLEPRLGGLRRYIWSTGKMRIDAAIPLLLKLSEASVKFILIKGSVLLARDTQAATDRFMADIDVLVDQANWPKAVDIALKIGWSIERELPKEIAVHRMRQRHHSLSLQRGLHGAVDLHNFSLLLNRQLGADEMLWKRAECGMLNGMPVHLPHPSDQLAIVFGHCFLFAPARSHDWIFDALRTISTPGFDWNLFTEVVIERELAVPSAVALTYLSEVLRCSIPKSALKRVVGHVREPFITEFAAAHRAHVTKNWAESRAIYQAERIRSRRFIERVPIPPQNPDRKKSAETILTNIPARKRVALAIPSDVRPDECVSFQLMLEADGLLPGGSARVLLRCFDGIPLEIGRLFLRSTRGRQRLSGRIDGALIAARGIDQLWLVMKGAPQEAVLNGWFRASLSRDPWADLFVPPRLLRLVFSPFERVHALITRTR